MLQHAFIPIRLLQRSPIRRWPLFGVLLFAPLLAACRAEVGVDVSVVEDGSGTVVVALLLDREAAAALVDLNDDGLRLDDLVQAGWDLDPPEAAENGSVLTRASKDFGTPEQFVEVVEELSGDSGLFADFVLTRELSFARVDYRLTGALVPTGLDAFGDPALDAALGQTLEQLAATYGAAAADVDIELAVRLPGEIDPVESNGAVDIADQEATSRVWRTTLSPAEPERVAAHSSTQKVAALVWRGVAVVAGVLAGLLLFGHVLRLVWPERRRGRGGRGRGGRRAGGGQGAGRAGGGQGAGNLDDGLAAPKAPAWYPSTGNGRTAARMVAIDGMGVLYLEGDDIRQLLVPFVRGRGSEVSVDEIVARARLLSLGRITTAEFWRSVGLVDDPALLDAAYLASFQLTPGVVRFLRNLRGQGVQLAVVTNDCTTWADKLRSRHSLEGLIDSWIVSGAVGGRKPDAPIFEVLRRTARLDPAEILVVDDDLDNLDAARSFGYATAWFGPAASSEQSRGHAVLRSFDVTAPD